MLRVRALGLLLLAIAGLGMSSGAQASRWGKDYFPEATVITQDGKALQFYDDLIKDKVFVISFLFTTCRDICPLATARLADLQDLMGDALGRDVFFYSISIDPETDTPERLKQYADTFRAKPGWLFLTGKPEDIYVIRHKLGERSKVLSDHRNEILLGNGATGEWARNNVLGDLGVLAHTVRSMDPAWKSGASTRLSDAKGIVYDFAAHPGEAMFRRLCASCHTVGQGDRVGPDLKGVAQRRSRDWLVNFISNPEKMRREKDATALALVAQFPTVRMPPLGISEHDAGDLLIYLETRQAPPPGPRLLEPLAALTDQNGQKFSLARLKGEPVAVVFGFTHCPDVCPTTLLDWSNVLSSLGPDGDRMKVVFVSVDSERDTPEALKAYLASFDPRIIALAGSADEIAAAAQSFDAFYEKVVEKDGSITYDHTIKSYLVDRNGRLARSVDLKTSEADRRKALAALLAKE